MKKMAAMVVLIMLISIIGILLINEKEQETEVTKQATKVGVLLNGSKEDRSWGQSQYEGLLKSAEALNLEIVCEEYVPEDINSVTVMEELIKLGCKIIVCDSYGYGTYEKEVAMKYPEIYFFHATGVEQRKNLSAYFGRMYQMRYLSGIVAGLQTKTNEIGYVAGFPIAEVNRGINAFTLGVLSVNDEATVHVRFAESWTGDEESREATEYLLSHTNMDVIGVHVNSLEPLRIAEEKGIWSIGYNYDNRELFPKTYLTAPIWHWEKYYIPHILRCLQGKFYPDHSWDGLETELIALAPFSENVSPLAAERVEEAKQAMLSGNFDVFYGPIYDQQGRLRVGENESMSDQQLLNGFDWYVKGVIVYE